MLTRQLAPRCEALISVDIAGRALRQAEERCRDLPWVRFEIMDLRRTWPPGRFDLILLSEVLYYLGLDGIETVARHARDCLQPGGTVLLVNWHSATDGACSGDEAASLFLRQSPTLAIAAQHRTERYRLDLLTTPGPTG